MAESIMTRNALASLSRRLYEKMRDRCDRGMSNQGTRVIISKLERLSNLLQDESENSTLGANPWYNEDEEIERVWNEVGEDMYRWCQTGQFPRDELALYAELRSGMNAFMRGGNLILHPQRLGEGAGHQPSPGEVIAGIAVGAAGAAIAGLGALRLLGFGNQGPDAGSFASRRQSQYSDVPAASSFSHAQSAGMRAPNGGGGFALSLGLGAMALGVALATGKTSFGTGDDDDETRRRRM